MKARLATVGVICSLAVAWLWVGPSQLGGGVTYVTTHGISMQPGIHAGDLIMVREADTYGPGDAVAYDSGILKTVVLHRIVSVEDGEYTFKGDNNSWLDPDHPTKDQLVGKQWFLIPQGGVWLERITSPPMLAALAFLLLLAGSKKEAQTRRSRRKRRKVSQEAGGDFWLKSWWTGQSTGVRTTVSVAGAIALLGILLALLSWTKPLTVQGTSAAAAGGKVEFAYSAAVPTSPAYQSRVAKSPDPIFRKLTNQVDVHYNYTGPPGTVEVVAQLSNPSGWHWTVPLAAPTSFEEPNHQGTVTLDLNALAARSQAGAKASGIPAGDNLAISVVPTIDTSAGRFEPALKLNLTPLELTLADDPETLIVTGGEGSKTVTTKANSLAVLGMSINVTLARYVSLGLIVLGLAIAGAILLMAPKPTQVSEAESIRRRYASLLLPVDPMPDLTGSVVEVPAIADLAKLARQYALMIMHGSVGGIDTFVVQDEHVAYRFISYTEPAPPTSAPVSLRPPVM